jgi:hypothetical protein
MPITSPSESLLQYAIVRLYVKNVAVLTTGSPADIAVIAVPSWLTRYICIAPSQLSFQVVAETAAGTLGGATFLVRDGIGGTGTSLVTAANGPTAAGGIVMTAGLAVIGTGMNLYIRQTANSGNAGTCSFYVTLFPLP